MQIVGLTSILSLFVVGAVVGSRLLLVARRTRETPELVIGLGLLLITVLGYPFSIAGRLPALLGTTLGDALFGLGLSLSFSGIVLVYVFTWKVFRPRAPWARHVVAVAALALAAEAAGLLHASAQASIPREIFALTRPWACAVVATVTVAFAWTGAESLAYYLRLRRRLRIGLADPAVTNRFLLWAVSGFATAGLCVGIIASLAAGYVPLRDTLPLVIIAFAGITISGAWYLAFLPPAAYLDLLQRRAA